MILTVVVVWFMAAYVFQGTLIRALSKSHGATRKEEPALYNLVENMCIARGLKMPRLEIIETHARNAFASGVDEGTYCITITRGLMQSLAQDELEAVLAHELTHIINRDVRLMMVCVVFTGMLGLSTQLLWSYMRYNIYVPRGNRREGGAGLLLLALLAILGVGYLATLLTRFALSRRREFMADAGAVQITKNPEAMMRALLRISGAADIPAAPADVRAMCFENQRAFMGIFATHPPIASRIKAISNYSGLPVPNLKPKISANEDEAFGRPAAARDNWTTRQRFKNRRANPWT
jgi:heat shock protein HtpX